MKAIITLQIASGDLATSKKHVKYSHNGNRMDLVDVAM